MHARTPDRVLIDKKKRNLSSSGFCSLSGSVKIKKSEKRDKYLDFIRELQKSVEHRVTVISITVGAWNGPQRLGKKTGGTENQRKKREHQDHSNVKMG